MLRIYVSGPYTSDPEANTETAMNIGHLLLDLDVAPYVPHLTHFMHQQCPRDYEDWMALDLEYLQGCDALYRFAGESAGADREVARAQELGIPVFTDFMNLEDWIFENQLTGATQQASVPEPIRVALDQIESTFARKNADYADEKQSWSSNFEDVASQMGWESSQESAEALIAVKQARLRSMRANGRLPLNESVLDTKLDRAVYSVIALALAIEEAK